MKHLICTLLLLTTLNSNAHIYKGMIGKIPIYLEYHAENNTGECYGSYFYQSQCIDIPIEGTISGTKFTLYAGTMWQEKEEKELFNLVLKGKTLSGTWKANGKTLKVVLTKINEAAFPNPYDKNPFVKTQPFAGLERIRTSFAKFKSIDSTTSVVANGMTIVWYKEAHWDSQFFRIKSGLPDSTIKWVNNYLEYKQLVEFSNFGTCGAGVNMEYNTSISDYFLNSDFLSINFASYYYCGGAHPDFSSEQVNLDLKNHLLLSTEDLLQFDGFVQRDDANFDEWAAYRSETFVVLINDYFKATYPEYYADSDETEGTEETESDDYENECFYDDPMVWQFSGVNITTGGFKFSAYFYRAMRICDDPEWAYIPYEVFADYLNPKYKKALLAIPH